MPPMSWSPKQRLVSVKTFVVLLFLDHWTYLGRKLSRKCGMLHTFHDAQEKVTESCAVASLVNQTR